MNEFFKTIPGAATILSISTFIVGTIIITINLNRFDIVDFDLLKPHAIGVGFCYLLFMVINGLGFFLYSDIKNFFNQNWRKATLTIFFRAFTLVTYISGFLGIFDEIDIHPYKTALQILLQLIAFYWGFTTMVIVFDGEHIFFTFINEVLKYITYIVLIIFWYLFHSNQMYINVVTVELFFALLLLMILLINQFDIKLHNHRKKLNPDLPKSMSVKEKYFGSYGESKFMDMFIRSVAIVFFLTISSYLYARLIFPYISPSYGGGQPKAIIYIQGKDTIAGAKIYETKDYVFLYQNDGTIAKLDWKDITKIINPNSYVQPQGKIIQTR